MHAEAVNYWKEILCTKVENSNVIKINACLELGKTCCIINHEQEAVLYYKKGLKIAEEEDNRKAIMILFLKLGETCLTLNKYHESILYFKKSMEIAKEVGARETEKYACFQLGKLYWTMNQHEDSIMYGQKSFQLAKEMEDKVGKLEACKLLHNSYVMLDRYEEAISSLETCIKIFKENGDMHGEAEALLVLGNSYYELNQIDNSITYLRRCCELAKNIGEKPTEMKANFLLGHVYQKMETYDDAIICGEKAIELAKELDDKKYEMSCSFLLGQTLQMMEENDEAVTYCKACIDIAKAKGDEFHEMNASLVAGMACHSIKRYDDALSYGLKCFEIFLRIGGQKVCETKAYSLLAMTYFDLNQNDNAVMYSKKCIEMAEKIDDKQSKVVGYLVLGDVHRNLNNNDDAIHFAQKALKIARAINNTHNYEIKAYVMLGCAYKSKAMYDEAIDYTRKSMEIAAEIKNQDIEMQACYVLGEAYLSKHDFGHAVLFSENCISIAHNMNLAVHFLVIRAHLNAAESHYSLSNYKQAISHSEKCIVMAKEAGDEFYEMNACFVLGKTYQSLGEFEKAETYSEKCIDVIKKTGNNYFEMNARLLSLCNSYGLNKYDDAIKYGNLCIEMAKLHGDKAIEMCGYLVLSATYKELEKYEEAVDYSKNCIALARRSNEKIVEMKALLVLAKAHLSLGHLDLAISRSGDCINLAFKAGDKSVEMKAYYLLSDTYLCLQRYDNAINCGSKCIELAKSIGDKDCEARACLLLGRAYDFSNQLRDVIAVSARCLAIAKETRNKFFEMQASLQAGRAYGLLAQYEKALHLLNGGLKVAEELKDVIAINEFQFFVHSTSSCAESPVEAVPYGKDVFFNYFWRKMQAEPKKRAVVTFLERYNEYKIRNDYELALKYLDKAIDAEPHLARSGLEVDRAQMYVYLNRNHQALEILQDELPFAIQNENKLIEAECYFWLGKVHQKLGQIEEAEESLRKSIRCFEFMFYHVGEFEKFKISITDKYVRCFKELSKLLIETERFEQALFISDGCRARVLKDLLSPKLEIEQDNLSSKDIIHLLSGRNCAILFYSLSDTELYTFLVDESGKVGLTKSALDCKTHLKAMSEKVFEELEVRTAVNSAGKKSQVHTSPISSSQEGPNLPKQGFLLRFDILKEPSENNDESSMANSLERLHHKLIYNVPGLEQKDEIVIIPDDFLHEVPFAALRNPDTGKYLSETKRIRFAPSIATLKLLQNYAMDRHHQSGALIIGDPLVGKVMMNGEEKEFISLKGALEEAADIALILGMDPPLLREDATKAAVIEKLQQGVSIVHVAAHGNLKKAAILLAPSETRTTKIPDEEDYMLTMADVQQAHVRAQLVVLSCCYSGRGEIRAEGVVGMCRAFLASGARAVVASLWAIDDDATLVFMNQFYKYLKEGESASTSLHLTMNYMRQHPRYSEPKYWAAFFLMGDDVTINFSS